MSERELLRKFYFGLYKLNSRGHIACPLYDENIAEDNQLCDVSMENQGEEFTDEQFHLFWSHVRAVHQTTYENILEICRAKASKRSNENQPMKVYGIIGSTFGNLNKLAAEWTNTGINGEEFLAQFRSELESLQTQVNVLVNSTPSSNTTTGGPSLTKL